MHGTPLVLEGGRVCGGRGRGLGREEGVEEGREWEVGIGIFLSNKKK